jgi:hypothetical protein
MTQQIDQGTISTATLAKLLMLTPRSVNRLAADGHIPRATPKTFALAPAVQAYIKYLQADRKNQTQTAAANRVAEARALEIERRLAREDRLIITLEESMLHGDTLIGMFLASLSSLPARITRNLPERRRIELIIDQERQRLADEFDRMARQHSTGQKAED